MKTAGSETQTRRALVRGVPELAERKARTILLNGAGWKDKKKSGRTGSVFFPDSFYRTHQELSEWF